MELPFKLDTTCEDPLAVARGPTTEMLGETMD